MTFTTDWPCWEIMKCNPENARQCPAYKSSNPCWEVMRKIDAYSFNICRDCIVYLIKQKDCILSKNEIKDILQQKGLQAQAPVQCPQFTPPGGVNYLEGN